MARGAARGLPGAAFALAILVGGAAAAHLVGGTPSLRQRVIEANVVTRARIAATDAAVALESGEQRPVVDAELLEVFKGAAETGPLRFVQHGHGVALFEPDDEVLLFLRPIERSREMRSLGRSGAVGFVSLQDHDAKYPLTASNRKTLLDAVRAYVRSAALAKPTERLAELRVVTVSLLTSGDTRLAAGALRDLVGAGNRPLVTAAELPALEPVISDPKVAIGVRVGLLAELDRRGLVEGPPRWVALLETTSGTDRAVAARAAGGHPSPAVTAALIALLADDDAATAAAAAIALGKPAYASAVPALAACLGGSEPRLRMAAIRGLGGIGTPEAAAVLAEAGAAHPDAATRRRARAEAMVLAGRTPP